MFGDGGKEKHNSLLKICKFYLLNHQGINLQFTRCFNILKDTFLRFCISSQKYVIKIVKRGNSLDS